MDTVSLIISSKYGAQMFIVVVTPIQTQHVTAAVVRIGITSPYN